MSELPLITKFKANKDDLISLVSKYQLRAFSEEIDFLEELGGDHIFEDLLAVDYTRGIIESEISERQTCYGTGEIKEPPMKSFLKLWWAALDDFTLKVLLVAATISIIANMAVEEKHRATAWVEGFAIYMAVAACSLTASGNDYQKEKQFRKLKEAYSAKKEVNVWRNGKLSSIHETRLVTGDIVKIAEGMDIPADMMLLEAHDITSDESALTGEPNAMKKKAFNSCLEKRDEFLNFGGRNNVSAHDIPSPILMSGTSVLTGEGKAIVLVVGESSIIGQIRKFLATEAEVTPLQHKLEKVTKDIGKLGSAVAILTLIILIIRFLVDRGVTSSWGEGSEYVNLVRYVIIVIAVITVAIPEGLPLAVTISLAYSTKQMMKDKNLVRKLYATETMGGANNICSDKTGTLTQNKMTFTHFWNTKIIEINPYEKGSLHEVIPEKFHDLLRQALACNSSATLTPCVGSKTEIALLEFLEDRGESSNALREKHLPPNAIKFPFSSQRKRMSSVLENVENGLPSRRRMHIKGASELVLDCCTHFYSFEEDKIIPMTENLKQNVEDEITAMANKALRTICIGYKEINGDEDFDTKDDKNVYEIEKNNFILLGVLGIRDVLRKEVKDAVAKCKRAGIKVRMVTGDNKITARAIALECGIIDPNDNQSIVITGTEFIDLTGGIVCKKCKTKECDCPRDKETARRVNKEVRVDTIANQEAFDSVFKHLDVLARSRPEDKYALVTGLLERQCVVAVTGDGTNDAPALKKADVGFAMNSGTDVCKEAADIILLDDNFASIVKAAMWGRNIYDNIRRFLQFQLTVNIAAVTITLMSAIVLKDGILTAVQLLWVNLIMDVFVSLALATEPPTEKLLDYEPYNRNDYILSKPMMKHIIGQALFQLIAIMTLAFSADSWVPEYLPHEDIPGFPGEDKYYSDDGKHMRSGRPYKITEIEEDYHQFEDIIGPSRHYTLIFNTFAFCQIFNYLNCRKIHEEFNVFSGLSKNPLFYVIGIIITGLQLAIGNFGGLPFSVSYEGMHVVQWLIAVGVASFTLVWSIVLKLIPTDMICLKSKKKPVDSPNSSLEIVRMKRSQNEENVRRPPSLSRQESRKPSLTLTQVQYRAPE